MKYDVLLHNVPKVSEDGTKSLPIAAFQTKEFSDLEEAQKFAAEQKDKFDRVVVMRTRNEKQRMMERYMDGEHIINDKPEEPEEEAAPAAEAAESEAAAEGAAN